MKKNDTVQVIKESSAKYCGIGEIIDVRPGYGNTFKVEFGDGSSYWYSEKSLNLLQKSRTNTTTKKSVELLLPYILSDTPPNGDGWNMVDDLEGVFFAYTQEHAFQQIEQYLEEQGYGKEEAGDFKIYNPYGKIYNLVFKSMEFVEQV